MQKWQRAEALVALVLAVTITLGACSKDDASDDTAASGLTKVRYNMIPSLGSLWFHDAQEEGFFEDNGLEVEGSTTLDFTTVLLQISRGKMDVTTAPTSAFLAAVQKNIDVVAYSSNVANSATDIDDPLVTAPALDFSSYADLQGARVGVTSLTSDNVTAIKYLVAAEGGDPEAVTFLEVGLPQQIDQLKAKRIDAVVSGLPFSDQLKEAGFEVQTSPIYDSQAAAATKNGGSLEYSPTGVLVTSRKLADEKPEIVEGLRKAQQQASEWIAAHDAEARKYLEAYTGLPAEVANSTTIPRYLSDYPASALDAYISVGRSVGVISGDLPPAEDLVIAP